MFPGFGSERTGAPVMSFCRIDDKPIRTREPVTEPDALITQDPTLLHQAELFGGFWPRRLHAGQLHHELRRARPGRVRPGASTALTWAVSLDAVLAAINDRFAGLVAEGNATAARAAFDFVRDEREALTEAAIS
jgi:pyruvate ferredoxin oxidoreductase gamma subunit